MSDEILFNSPALHALKRHQLVSLSKRYGLKASGKNVDMIGRLRDYASTLTPTRSIRLPLPAPTPAHVMSEFGIEEPASPMRSPSAAPMSREAAPSPSSDRRLSKASDAWEVLSEDGASLISPGKGGGMTKSSSVRSWKSAGNGEPLSEFGMDAEPSTSTRSKSSSLRSLASSLSRRASTHLMHRSGSASSKLDKLATDDEEETPAEPTKRPPSPFRALAMSIGRRASQHLSSRPAITRQSSDVTSGETDIEMADDQDQASEESQMCPPSPASTVGIPRRYSRISLLERPSTIRLISPEPPIEPVNTDDLPFFSTAQVKERRSMAPLRSSHATPNAGLTRKSMPAIAAAHSASVPMLTNIYPKLPTTVDVPPVPAIPGAYKAELKQSPAKPAAGFAISNADFDLAGQKVLAEMEAKMKERLPERAASFGTELLKGKKAEIGKLVQTTHGLGEGGWGLRNMASSCSIQDRYAAAHQREFAKMQSIESKKHVSTFVSSSKTGMPSLSASTKSGMSGSKSKVNLADSTSSPTHAACLPPQTPGKRKLSSAALNTPSAPNGGPLIEEPLAKRKKLSPGPNAFGSLRDAGRSLANLLGDGRRGVTPAKKRKRRSSVTTGGLASRFGLFKSRHRDSLTQSTASTAAKTRLPKSSTMSSLPMSTATSKASSSMSFSGMRSSTTQRSMSTVDLAGQPAKERNRSTSAQTFMSTSSKASSRPPLPDFDGPALARSGSINALGLPAAPSGSGSSHTSMRKQSQVEMIRKARPAPAPPIVEELAETTAPIATRPRPTAVKRASTLHQPTASSLARMQATVKPNTERPLPTAPSSTTRTPIATSRPFGTASSRTTFDSSFNVAPPSQTQIAQPTQYTATPVATRALKSALKTPTAASPRKTPSKHASSSALRARQRASGLSAVKSKGNLKADGAAAEVQAKRAEIRARQMRIGEERELRELLGDGNVNMDDQEMI